jgi:hypothetical protein
MTRHVSLVEIFDLLENGLTPEEIKTRFASIEPDIVDRIARSLENTSSLLDEVKSRCPDIHATKESERARESFSAWLYSEHQVTPDVGQIWSVRVPDAAQRCLAAILDTPDNVTDNTVVIAPVSTDIEFAADTDLVISGDESPLGYQFMIEAWNYATVSKECLREYQTVLGKPLESYLLALYTHCLIGDTLQDVCAETEMDCGQLEMHIGSILIDQDDPRVYFRRREARAYRDLWKTGIAALAACDASATQLSDDTLIVERGPALSIHDRLKNLTAIFKASGGFSDVLASPAVAHASSSVFGQGRVFEATVGRSTWRVMLGYFRDEGELYLRILDIDERLRNRDAHISAQVSGIAAHIEVDAPIPQAGHETIIVLKSQTPVTENDVETIEIAVEA